MKRTHRYDGLVRSSSAEQRRLCFILSPETAADRDALPALLTEAQAQGFTTVMLTCAWYLAERQPLRYSFGYYDRRIALIRDAGMDVILRIDLRRVTHIFDGERVCTDMVLNTDEFFHADGAELHGDNEPLCISLASSKATGYAVRFFRDAVKHFCDTFGDTIYAVLPTFSPDGNSEYPAAAMDASVPMLRAYRGDLPLLYRATAELNLDLHTHFPAFGAAELPSSDDRGAAGMLYYRCRHRLLLDFIERLAGAKRLAAPDVRFALRFGSVTDASAAMRCTYGFESLGKCADLVLISENAKQSIAFTMDYAASAFSDTNGRIRIGACGPQLLAEGEDDCVKRYAAAYRHNATVLCADALRQDNAFRQIADAYLCASAPFCVSEHPKEEQVLEVRLSKLFFSGNGLYYTGYYDLYTENGLQFGRVRAKDDLTDCILPNSIAGKRLKQARQEASSPVSRLFRKEAQKTLRAAAFIAGAAIAAAVAAYALSADDD